MGKDTYVKHQQYKTCGTCKGRGWNIQSWGKKQGRAECGTCRGSGQVKA